jgi:hypothetical protein
LRAFSLRRFFESLLLVAFVPRRRPAATLAEQRLRPAVTQQKIRQNYRAGAAPKVGQNVRLIMHGVAMKKPGELPGFHFHRPYS